MTMDLSKILDMQRALDVRIEKQHPRTINEDRLAKKILALQVELGELANEWRGFKFWSTDQDSRRRVSSLLPKGYRNPLLEEYVDCLHFILSIGLELNFVSKHNNLKAYQESSIINQFIELSSFITELFYNRGVGEWIDTIQSFLGLGEMLGFTWEQIEQAYVSKNEVNHERQTNGY